MQVLGNILLIIATLAFISILPAQIGLEKAPGGDYGVGYAWVLILKGALFILCLLLLTITIGLNGGFAGLVYKNVSGVKMAIGGILLVITSIMLISNGRFGAWDIAEPIKKLIGSIPVVLQVLLLVAGFILVNQKMLHAPFLLKGISLALISVSILGISVIFLGNQVRNQQLRNEFRKDNPDGLDGNQQRMLTEIDSCDMSKNMVFLLVYTDDNQHKRVREKAVAKIKTNANWQQELITKLQNDWAPEVFTFLASNDVDSAALFLEPIQKGILIQAKLVRERIQSASHQSDLYSGLFLWEIERLMRTVDKFDNMGVDYLPAMKELRNALNEPSRYGKKDFSITPKIDKWIKKHQKAK